MIEFILHLFIYYFVYMCVYACVYVYMCLHFISWLWRSEDNQVVFYFPSTK